MVLQFQDIFDMKEKLGQGAFGLVMRCVEKKTGSEFAVKIMSTEKMTAHDFQDLENEARICRKLKNHNVVRLHHIFEGEDCHYFVFDLVRGGELFHDIVDRDVYSEADASYCMQQILETINHCHKNDVIHRDLKPQNLLLESKRRGAAIKLADFGMAIEIKGNREYYLEWCGTPGYMAPEILMRKPYGKAVDIWACGVILHLLLVGHEPFSPEETNFKQFFTNNLCSGIEWNKLTSGAKDLVHQMLEVNSWKRITAANALKHPWIYQRERVASDVHLQETVECIKQFNARRKFKAAARVVMLAKGNFKIPNNILKKEDSETTVSTDSGTTVSTDSETTVSTDSQTTVSTDSETTVSTDSQTTVSTDSQMTISIGLSYTDTDTDTDCYM